MKTSTLLSAVFALFFTGGLFAQDRTTVTATNSDISDNLDLRAVASIFGESRNLEDFEQRINDPKAQISNLDLNGDGYVDYLRVMETNDNNDHLIVLQAVLEKDVFQDVATIEVQRDGDNVQVQVVGDIYMYGPNYIYEPVYVTRPLIYTWFWGVGYHPYRSPYYWGYYPSYYTYWQPYPVYRYRRNVNVYINVHNHYNYVNTRNPRFVRLYEGRRQNGYERQHPGRSFEQRTLAVNKREYDVTRRADTKATRAANHSANPRSSSTRKPQNNGTITRANNGLRTGGNTRNTGVRSTAPVKAPANVRSGSPAQNPRASTPSLQNNSRVNAQPSPTRSVTSGQPAVPRQPSRNQANAPSMQRSSPQAPPRSPQVNGSTRSSGNSVPAPRPSSEQRRGRG